MIKNNNNNNTPYLRKKISTLLTLSAIVLLLLITSPMVFSNFLFQPVQAQEPVVTFNTFKTPSPAFNPASLEDGLPVSLTFSATGTLSTNSPDDYQKVNGTFQITYTPTGRIMSSGDIDRGQLYYNRFGGVSIKLVAEDGKAWIVAHCNTNYIVVNDGFGFEGAVECSSSK